MYSLFQVVSQTMPIRAMPTPACANIVPQFERGNPRARRSAVTNGTRNRPVRSARSLKAPAMTNTASPIASGASALPPRVHAHSTATAINAAMPAAVSRCAAPSRSPRFHASNGPNGTTINSGTNSGPKVRLKNGAPTEILSPVSTSSANGYSVPTNTVAQAVVRNRLLSTSAPSREIGANRPPCFSAEARQTYSERLPPMKMQRIKRMNTPRVGSFAKASTEVSTPERTRKVPSSDSEKARIDSRTVQTLSELRFSITTSECNSAVPASHGISDAFSTGSQNHQPPQPSS